MRSASSRDGAVRRNAKIEYESTRASRCVATSVNAKASWNKINASLFVATSVDATAKAMQRNELCSVISQTFRGAGTSASSLDGATQGQARGARALSSVESL